ncbi:MAG: type III pantothenate kinase [Rhodanobacteraceae bacterium]
MNANAHPAWLFDLGNSRLKGALLIDEELARPFVLEWGALDFDAVLCTKLAHWPAPSRVLVASVAASERAARLREALRGWPDVNMEWLLSPRERCGIVNSYRVPERLGIDRFLAMAAARAAANDDAAIVIGCGTALTLDAVDKQGTHREGMIAPSSALMIDALRRATAIGDANPRAFNEDDSDDTARAIDAGCAHAAAALVEWFHARQAAALGAPCLWLHGGGSMSLQALLEQGESRDRTRMLDDAVLRGLALWAVSERTA